MQTTLPPELRDTDDGRDAERILRTCVHCGICNATCPTYQLLGDERDGPRGRIYQIKEMLEHGRASEEARLHLDRCLTCRSCETTCPSGVEYHRLLEIGRDFVERTMRRPLADRLRRDLLLATVPRPDRLRPLLAVTRAAVRQRLEDAPPAPSAAALPSRARTTVVPTAMTGRPSSPAWAPTGSSPDSHYGSRPSRRD